MNKRESLEFALKVLSATTKLWDKEDVLTYATRLREYIREEDK